MKIYAVGFRKRPEAWPSEWDFRPLPRARPPEGPIVVHLSALKRFIRFAQRMAASQASGRLPEAVLYVPKGKEPPPEAAVYFDAVVREGEEARLAELLSCPLRLSMDEWVEELPLEAVFTQGPEPWKYGRLPEAVRQHLEACKSCREAFREALEFPRGSGGPSTIPSGFLPGCVGPGRIRPRGVFGRGQGVGAAPFPLSGLPGGGPGPATDGGPGTSLEAGMGESGRLLRDAIKPPSYRDRPGRPGRCGPSKRACADSEASDGRCPLAYPLDPGPMGGFGRGIPLDGAAVPGRRSMADPGGGGGGASQGTGHPRQPGLAGTEDLDG